jgi:hypothetical protein
MPQGEATLRRFFPGAVWLKNVQVGADGSRYGSFSSNHFPTNIKKVGFANLNASNYRLAPGSPYKNAATDGKDIGCDFDALMAALGKAQTGLPVR